MPTPPSDHGPQYRSGIGYDAHRLVAGRALVLGGVVIAHDRGLQGHSDADVLVHAIMDALLGAAALGDIGEHFPDTDPCYQGASSIGLLKHVAGLLAREGQVVANVDAVLLAEAPRIAPYKREMRARIAAALGIGEDQVGLKATTNEGLGFVGTREGMAAYATALLRRDQRSG